MSSVVQAKCPNCKTPVSVEEEQSVLPVTCSSCQTKFVPAEVIAESNKRFEIALYVGMIVVALGLFGYMAATGNLQPKADAPEAVEPAEEAAE
jgi:hypothetical protein